MQQTNNMQPKQANHQLKLNMQLKIILLEILLPMNIYLQVNHPSATIGQLQIVGLTGRHLGAKPKMQPIMQANHQLKLMTKPNIQLNLKQIKKIS